MHFWERECSIQRRLVTIIILHPAITDEPRFQKIIEVPSFIKEMLSSA